MEDGTCTADSVFGFLLGQSLIMIPGGSSACIQLFDGSGSKIGSWLFQTGWRINFLGASLEYSTRLGTDLVVLHVGPVINGLPIAEEYCKRQTNSTPAC